MAEQPRKVGVYDRVRDTATQHRGGVPSWVWIVVAVILLALLVWWSPPPVHPIQRVYQPLGRAAKQRQPRPLSNQHGSNKVQAIPEPVYRSTSERPEHPKTTEQSGGECYGGSNSRGPV